MTLKPTKTIELENAVTNLSGVAAAGGRLYLIDDETPDLRIRDLGGTGAAKATLLKDAPGELDLEGIAADGARLFIVGSHSARRKRPDKPTYAKNRERVFEVDDAPVRRVVLSASLKSGGSLGGVVVSSLGDYLDKSPLFSRFVRIPSKEGGIDIEGIAFKSNDLFIGFRAPVFREGYAAVLNCEFQPGQIKASDEDIAFLPLGGRGVRDLAAVAAGFLVLAGPVGDWDAKDPGAYQLYLWDGHDCLPGKRELGVVQGSCKYLGDVPTHDGKPEGLAVLSEGSSAWKILIVEDGPAPKAFEYDLTK
jgi:hypothetical protein